MKEETQTFPTKKIQSALSGWGRILLYGAGLLLLPLAGCTSYVITPFVVSPALNPVVENMNRQDDLQLVCDGAPAFLLMIDSLIASDPTSEDLLKNGTQAYSSYATVVAECNRGDRAAQLSTKAKQYGMALLKKKRLLALGLNCQLSDFSRLLQNVSRSHVDSLFWAGYSWATWIGFQEGAPAAMADLPKVEQIMKRVLELDESFFNGGAHIFLGVYNASRPVMYGGKPELSKKHFEQALLLSRRRYLPTMVAYARFYARMIFDRALYEELLKEVVAFDLKRAPELTLSNIVAKKQAAEMLADIDKYF
jgi:hypothetical protein